MAPSTQTTGFSRTYLSADSRLERAWHVLPGFTMTPTFFITTEGTQGREHSCRWVLPRMGGHQPPSTTDRKYACSWFVKRALVRARRGAKTAPRARPWCPPCSATCHVACAACLTRRCMHDAPIMRAPGERVTLKDCPLHTAQRCHRSTTRSLDCQPGPRLQPSALAERPGCTSLGHRGLRRPFVPQRHDNQGEGVVHSAPCSRFSKHDATWDLDCCNCVTSSSVRKTP